MADGLKWLTVALAALAALLGLATRAPAQAVTFGTGTNQFSMTFNAVNATFEMADTEVIWDSFDKFYVAATGNGFSPTLDPASAGGPYLSANGTSMITPKQVVDFINWLNTSAGFPAAYTFNAAHTALVNWNRNPGAKYCLPTGAEWNTALSVIHYAPTGPVVYEWIQPLSGNGGKVDGLKQGQPSSGPDSWTGDLFARTRSDTGFRVVYVLPVPGPLHHFEVAATSMQTTGLTFSATVTAKDVDGTTLTNDSSTQVTMTSSGSVQFDCDGNGVFGDNTRTLTSGTFTITAKDNVAENVTLTASAGGKTGTSPALAVKLAPQAETMRFGTGANQFALTFNPASAAYRVGNTEVPNDAFNKFYLTTKGVAYAGNAGLPLTDAACNVSGIAAVDFINWLNTSSGLPAAYTFNADHTALLNWNRTPGAKFFLPTVAEWNGALASISYAFGPCIYEWIQDAAGAGGNLDGVENWRANKSFDESSFVQVYEDTGFRVMSDSSVGLTIRNPFDAWLAGAPLTGFSDDPNHDGVANGLAWLLNGSAMGNSRECLPLGATAAGKLVLSFQCLKASARGTAVLNVQYSNDLGVLDAWHSAAVPEVTSAVGGISFTVTPITASDYQTISAEIPLSAASSDGKLFGRLLGTQ